MGRAADTADSRVDFPRSAATTAFIILNGWRIPTVLRVGRAARRALAGFRSLNEGAAYALLRPTYVETYLPCRPEFVPGSFEEAVLAVHEADSVVVDAPDFVNWASEQPGVLDDAVAFARSNGMDW